MHQLSELDASHRHGYADVLPGAVAKQQRMPDQFFQLANLLAHGGLGAVHTLALLQEAKGLLFGAQAVPAEQGERQLRMPTYADEPDLACEAALDALDTRFYLDPDQLEERLVAYARQQQLFAAD